MKLQEDCLNCQAMTPETEDSFITVAILPPEVPNSPCLSIYYSNWDLQLFNDDLITEIPSSVECHSRFSLSDAVSKVLPSLSRHIL